MRFGVLGAGIVGLNTALELQNVFPTAQVVIIADKFNEETLSHGAAGIFRPGESFLGPSKEITRSWIIDSYNYYNEILRSSEADNAGIMEVSGYIFSSKYPSLTRNHFLESLLPMYREAEEDELQLCPGDWKFGSFMTTMVIESGRFLPWAMKKFEKGGGEVKQRRLNSFQDLRSFEPFDALVNCTGFGSKWLCQDTKLVPLRGQVFKVRAPWIKMFYYGDLDTYVIPGRDVVTLGGCRQYESYEESVSVYDSAAIWKRCTSLVPSLKKAAVKKEWVGLRPYRHLVKCNFERLRLGDKDTKCGKYMECDMRVMSVLVQSMVGVGGVEMPSLELPFLHQLLNGSSDEEDEKLFIQRSSSLKTTKSPPRSPHTKKIVRFADVLGLDLADVRTFLDEIPQVPKSAFRDLDPRSLSPTPSLGVIRTQLPVRSSKKTLVPSFHQPVSMSDFYTRIREQKVLLENAFLGENFKVRGTVRVMNLDFHKSVYFRYTLDEWKSFKESQASYSSGSCDGFSDRFEFSLMVKESDVEVGGRLIFALRFDCQGSEHWDNNRGRNYVFECVPSSSQNMMNSLCVPETTADDPWINHMWM